MYRVSVGMEKKEGISLMAFSNPLGMCVTAWNVRQMLTMWKVLVQI